MGLGGSELLGLGGVGAVGTGGLELLVLGGSELLGLEDRSCWGWGGRSFWNWGVGAVGTGGSELFLLGGRGSESCSAVLSHPRLLWDRWRTRFFFFCVRSHRWLPHPPGGDPSVHHDVTGSEEQSGRSLLLLLL